MTTKDEADKEARENWKLAEELEKRGYKAEAEEARRRAIEWGMQRDSWLYRTFGW